MASRGLGLRRPRGLARPAARQGGQWRLARVSPREKAPARGGDKGRVRRRKGRGCLDRKGAGCCTGDRDSRGTDWCGGRRRGEDPDQLPAGHDGQSRRRRPKSTAARARADWSGRKPVGDLVSVDFGSSCVISLSMTRAGRHGPRGLSPTRHLRAPGSEIDWLRLVGEGGCCISASWSQKKQLRVVVYYESVHLSKSSIGQEITKATTKSAIDHSVLWSFVPLW